MAEREVSGASPRTDHVDATMLNELDIPEHSTDAKAAGDSSVPRFVAGAMTALKAPTDDVEPVKNELDAAASTQIESNDSEATTASTEKHAGPVPNDTPMPDAPELGTLEPGLFVSTAATTVAQPRKKRLGGQLSLGGLQHSEHGIPRLTAMQDLIGQATKGSAQLPLGEDVLDYDASPPSPNGTEPSQTAGQATAKTKTPTKATKKRKVTEAEKALKKLVADHAQRKKAGEVRLEDEIMFMKEKNNAEIRYLQAKNDSEYDPGSPSPSIIEDNTLSPGQTEDFAAAPYQESSDEEDPTAPKKRGCKRKANTGADGQGGAKKKKTTRASKKARGKSAAEVAEDDDGGDLFEKAFPTSKQGKGAKKAPKKAAEKKKKKKPSGPTMTNTDSLFDGADVFQDTAATADLAAQPTFGATNRKDEAMKELMASIPTQDKDSKDVSRADQKALKDAIRAFEGTNQVVKPAEGGLWSVRGLHSALKAYQILGVGFMKMRESGSKDPRGGILADTMGLGKTLQVLCCIVNGLPERRSKSTRARGTTLIVSTPAIISQWFSEIQKHCKDSREDKRHGLGRVMVYKPQKCNDEVALLGECDIVLTTYHQISRSYPRRADCPPELTTAKQKDAWWEQHLQENRGVFHRMKWLRVVLDEATAIKNHKSQTSIACRGLDGKHKWAVSATPMMNRASELYPYLKFIGQPMTGTMRLFKQNYCSPDDPDGRKKLAAVLKVVCIRRTHLDTLFNARLLDLPKPTQHNVWLEFNAIERTIYDIVRRRFIMRINSISRSGQLKQKHRHVFSLLLRLRQLTSHVLLCAGPIVDLLELEDYERLNELCKSETEIYGQQRELLHQLRDLLGKAKGIDAGNPDYPTTEKVALPSGTVDPTPSATGGTHGLTFQFGKYLKNLRNSHAFEDVVQRALCVACRQTPDDPMITSCFHLYCKECLTSMQHIAARRGCDASVCAECGSTYDETRPIDQKMLEDAATSNPDESGTSRSKKKETVDDWTKMSGPVLPSAKTVAMKAQILNWLSEDPKVKIIVYTQFIGLIGMIDRICRTEKWGCCCYSGRMSPEAREKSIRDFGEDPEKSVLVASLRCGGMGLNLTMASKVICIDPWFNKAVEQQAFGRVHRIGQSRETDMVRLCVRNTIDADLDTMKEIKQIEIDDVVDGNVDMTTPEIMRLFGRVDMDEEGRHFIIPETEDEGPRMPNVDEDDEFQDMGNEE
ncbi:hypothetical protein MBLNU230_g2242t1 [Neophaeotheca triangularis]